MNDPTETGRGPATVGSGSSEAPVDGNSTLPARPKNWRLFYHTATNMKPRQLAGIAERKLRHAAVPRLPVDFDARYERRIPSELSPKTPPVAGNLETLRRCLSASERERYRQAASDAADGRFSFIGRTIEFDDGIDWDHEKMDQFQIVWRLKLQSFQHLEWLVLADEFSSTAPSMRSAFESQIPAWNDANPIGERTYLRRSWIPHAVSMRILNLCRYVAWREQADASTVPDEFYRVIYKNALFLENHVEYEISNNHLVENAIALVMAGVLFDAHDTGWIETGVELLERVGETQFLADGGHFERSPMYHVMVLRRYVTAIDLLSETDVRIASLRRTAERALGFLAEISKPDGEIPLLNDAVHGEQIDARSCLEYGNSCSLVPSESRLNHPDGSGYRVIETGSGTLLVDIGPVGPPHLPAHSHNDQLSVLLWIDGEQVLADTGVYDYGANERRQYARSVEAHNTAQYGDLEPIPIGGSYLMGKPTSIDILDSGRERIEARYSRSAFGDPQYEHRRTVVTTPTGWEITDDVRSAQTDEVTVRYHFDPSIELCETDGSADELLVRRDGTDVARFGFHGCAELRPVQTPYFERFGEERIRQAVEVRSITGTELTTRIDVEAAR